jgi:hypothetical protein
MSSIGQPLRYGDLVHNVAFACPMKNWTDSDKEKNCRKEF